MTHEEIARRVRSARVMLDKLKQAELNDADAGELYAMAGRLEFEVSLLELELGMEAVS